MDYVTFQKNVCKKIRELRLEKGLTQEEVSGLEMGVRAYQRIETGGNAPNLQSLYKIAIALGVHPKDLLNVSISDEKGKKK
ncbi:DNA-binding helix-turn-helix protein [Leptospira broomii serovar Hurstbridge str. 5399]|uniref:DNA-binding helix-turn-helix protein n=1 Tax=Leptospira broomii serovar Hurstbridge str. 5399 TaxID=1049789 RepID=T0F8B6_9LEPT|nr:helix-turn-helix transcriptional regulator [Leptospira broomii]EQA43752.1 DNA-binding helix-turn-helix protein [Leptospira broomii serovar Hurstbridge str. 5399]